MKEIVFIHSAGSQDPGEGSDGLIRNLKNSLGNEFVVIHPKMPNPQYPEYTSWRSRLKKELARSSDAVILVGHSLGGSVLLKYLAEENFNRPVLGLFLIAVPFWGEKGWEVEEFVLADNFAENLPQIPKIFLYHSLNDHVVPFSHLKIHEAMLKPYLVRQYGGNDHAFLSGLPELIKDIKSL